MNASISMASVPWELLGCVALLTIAPVRASPTRARVVSVLVLAVLQAIALFSGQGSLATVAVAACALVHGADAWRATRTGAVVMLGAALLTLVAAAALAQSSMVLAFVAAALAIAMRLGVLPLHIGVAALCDRAPVVQTQQLASLITLVFVHLRFLDHHAVAVQAAPWLVRGGAVAACLAAIMTLAQRDLRGFYRGTTTMHGGMVLAAIGTASLGNFAAALLVMVTMGLALGGLGIMTHALESRVGPVVYAEQGGRLTAFPVLAAAFALFGGAGVGMPGMAGFVADDLLLHTLWMESPASTVTMILASAFLAVGTLGAYSKVFLGKPMPSVAPDLSMPERMVVALIVVLLVLLGIAPGVLLTPADALLSALPS